MWTLFCLVFASLVPGGVGLLHAKDGGQSNVDPRVAPPFYAPLKSKTSSHGIQTARRSRKLGHGLANATSDIASANWWLNVQLGNQTVELMLDTGSSDTWVLREGFVCTNGIDTQPHSYCNEGPYFKGTFSGGQITDENFNASYASGEFLVGEVGYESVTVGGITVPRQEIGLIDYAYWPAGATGLIGMAFPALTRGVFNGTNATEDNSGVGHERLPSRTIFATMVEDGKIPPIFTVALGRNDSDESYIAFGESLPPVNLADQFVRTPMLLDPHFSTTEYTDYSIQVDAFSYPNYANASAVASGEAIIDSGTICITTPSEVAESYSKLFNPPAIMPAELGIYVTECDARGPSEPLDVVIEGKTFSIPGSSFVLSGVLLSDNGLAGAYGNYCFSGLQGQIFSPTSYILGRPFLENVVAVHDVGAKEMRFAQRKY